ncbi:MAG: hypothetical protein DWH96_04935 [Planctomycetota bacterium]|nr:MAG: hypothetical protein DWH96_04935 [Planctomycetota bacterium]RLS96314.1 MAG: hypothetical protein DWI11_00820 [Planctomycetota bacterium]RLT00817.1 MAG: hypothetical protein DWI20_00745 [Planctomycetota bacterium]
MKRSTLLLGATAVLAPTTVLFAQELSKPPEPGHSPKTSPVLGYGIAFLLFAMIVVLSLWPSKRSHTDL